MRLLAGCALGGAQQLLEAPASRCHGCPVAQRIVPAAPAAAEDNPRVLTRCGHHFHLPCLYEWLERSETCPVCAAPMHFEELLP